MSEREAETTAPGARPPRIEFLGTGGADTTPKPGCECRVCVEARRRGLPYSRTGPSLFVHGPDVLIDTPEEIKAQLNRSGVGEIRGCFYSHWHPDHVMGRRVWEMNADRRGWPPQNRCTRIFLPEQVAIDFRARLGSWDDFEFYRRSGWVEVVVLSDGEVVTLDGATVRPFRLAASYVYAFLFETAGRRVLIAPDELVGWDPPDWVHEVDLAVVPMGLCDLDPFTGERRIPLDHPVLETEATFEQTLEIVRKLRPRRVAFTHFEESDGLGYDDHKALEERLRNEGLDVVFAHDTLTLDLP